ncbi:hypothetical protein A3I27_04470 [Candidatus Giovannonibacteria bacterium RIFCSPLOWO2_02_FULL_43_11b]|uniref:Uncharacterized protein n=1 Tax=Candidatus Giovannonibacteria bacterium RIFCSPHIGHO2_12_FULL_43_15 TaxID=1798341 RepID=A0A1F5WPE4_9BACT|nr:MAG: hypothetical protein A3B97_02410 [Candidatus Giovannonibacteria bacterium RIFCSPHIGHO2_02_FULL_43_32]OGF77519.1 MAG: hypothetical protein A3F23_00905 [Candidatus Giovannonibacteria bacterium RIFCSPHIGHO2_12_FULL_43_15]OGF78980.1 MAG: hypothetical protein A3A15_00530 [Candidatus Giovannonibacteria bacterium RIFCSPLOWO2_01_FULL_43_60]OGF89963.1 MAG: hypothetical protein A3I27_04470 [Candidatus Giovannonibacteria bacterium RIFCSPLOWO2_02_FULL_43_11b]OGF92599.1 MAG: hypothetical protein A3H
MVGGAASTIENERFMALHGARVFGRRNSPLAKARKSAPEAVESVIRKLKEEIERGHARVTFIIVMSFGLLKDFGLDGMRVITRMAVESSTRGTAGVVGWGMYGLGWAVSKIPTPVTVGIGYGLQAVSYGVEYVGESMAISSGKAVDLTFMAISFMVSGAIFLLMWNKGWMMKPKLKYTWWGLGFFVDNLPKVSALPLTTISIGYTWMHVKRRSRAAEKKLANIEKLTQNEIEELDQDISILDRKS